LDRRTINEDEAHDLTEILDHASFGPDAERTLQRFIDERSRGLPNLSGPLAGRERRRVADVLEDEGNIRSITFTSPGTHLFYLPDNYRVVADMIREGDVQVFTFYAGYGTEEEAIGDSPNGSWRSSTNEMFVPEHLFSRRHLRAKTIVHEATHVIQDLNNRRLRRDRYEADAFIAGEIAFLRSGGDSAVRVTGIRAAARTAALSVCDHQSVSADEYEAVRTAVVDSGCYEDPETFHREFGGIDRSTSPGRATTSDAELQSLILGMEREEYARRRR
jgi:hypothetical protein